MKGLLRLFFLQAVLIDLTPRIFGSAFIIEPSPKVLMSAALVATVLHVFIKPILKLLILPLSIATLGIASILVHLVLLYLLTLLAPITVHAWQFPGITLGDIQLGTGTWSYFGTLLALSIWMAFGNFVLIWIME